MAEQLELGLQLLDSAQIGKILIAYEPVWAIGTGNACSPDDALSMLVLIKKFCRKNSVVVIFLFYTAALPMIKISHHTLKSDIPALWSADQASEAFNFLKMKEVI